MSKQINSGRSEVLRSTEDNTAGKGHKDFSHQQVLNSLSSLSPPQDDGI